MWAGHGWFMGQKWPTGRRFATYIVEKVFVLHRFTATQTVGPSPGQVARLMMVRRPVWTVRMYPSSLQHKHRSVIIFFFFPSSLGDTHRPAGSLIIRSVLHDLINQLQSRNRETSSRY